MYCKECGHRSNEITNDCEKCGARLKTEGTFERVERPKVRWHVVVAAVIIGILGFGILPRFLFRPELETIGPTDKLRFLRALENSDYRRIGQHGLRLERQTLIVIWDLRWNALPEKKQREIIRLVGRAWDVVGGEDTQFEIEGEEGSVAKYATGSAQLNSDANFSAHNDIPH
jgi:hypothetical protein